MQIEQIENVMGFHPATEQTREMHEQTRALFIELASDMADMLPESREKSLCFTKLQEALMFANAAIAINLAPLGND